MPAQASKRPASTATPAIGSGVVSMRLVPEILQAPSNLVKELNAGLETYVATIQSAITSDLQSRITKELDAWFPDSEKHHTEKILKKIVNSCLSPGVSGFIRTHDALKALGYWDENESAVSFTNFIRTHAEDDYALIVRRVSANDLKCNGCQKKRKNLKFMYEVTQNENADSKVSVWHSDCLATFILRETAKSYRSAKGSLDKQSIAVRGILGANKNNPILKGKKAHLEELGAASQYVSWLDQLFNHWSKTSDLKGESQAAYQSSFNEYASAISEYASTGTFPVEATKQRLAKHFESKEVDSVIDQFLTPRQLHILKVIRDCFEENGFAPTMRELGTAVGLSSPAAVKYQLDILTEKGYLRAETSQKPKAAALGHLAYLSYVDAPEDGPEASSFNQPEASHIVSIDAKDYSDARRVGEVYRQGVPVILNCSQMQESERKRLVDFASGLVLGFNGSIEKIAQGVFLLTPPDVVVEAKEKSASKTLVN
jgi:cell division inhibitor SepF